MSTDFFFGYGSLVNRATHDYPEAHPARVSGWRRAWRHTSLRPVAYLTAEPDPDTQIDGLVAAVPGADWAALDKREAAYDRHTLEPRRVRHPVGRAIDVQIYAVPEASSAAPSIRHPILLSYLDVVSQGFLKEFGEDGLADFFATTTGWDAPILNDRAAPRYPRHLKLSAEELDLVDHHLSALGAKILVD
ncbi:gamma-glutamylcyclotransferase family protein [Acidimangrovimonas pyrenivorans]|uniref:Gamma-glutamylcyclotransferase family protein n=1 Tax=Acidimangrovimonas pyrenivorans TaxID=2030798 RepID=A0ABV7ALV5_9RHOB